MDNIALLVLCFVLGIILRLSGRLPDNTPAALNGFVIHISLPALILVYVHGLRINTSLIYSVLTPWILFGIGFLMFVAVARFARWPAETTGGLILTGSLANTSFLGLPMIETFYGASFLGIGILMDQLGSYMVLSTVGIVVAATYASKEDKGVSIARVARKVISFAPFQALLVALLLRPFDLPQDVVHLFDRLGATLAPIALVSVGYQLRLGDLKGRIQPLAAGLLFKLLVGPALMALILVAVFGKTGEITQVTIFEAAMAPQIGAAVVAIDHKLDPPLMSLMLGIGIPLSFLTLPLWWYVLQGL
jgi:malate permease and related proteins